MTLLERIQTRSTQGMDNANPASPRFFFWLVVNAGACAWELYR